MIRKGATLDLVVQADKLKETIKILHTEKTCVERNEAGCDRNCARCDIVLPSKDILDAYSYAIEVLEFQLRTEIPVILPYKPLCPIGMINCIADPAYVYYHYPDWYREMYGDDKPADVVEKECKPYLEDGYCPYYDDEDK